MALTSQEKQRIIALALGRKLPSSGFERHFLKAIGGSNRACSAKEKEWVAYWDGRKLKLIFTAAPVADRTRLDGHQRNRDYEGESSTAESPYPPLSDQHGKDRVAIRETADEANHLLTPKAVLVSPDVGSSRCDGYDRLLLELRFAISRTDARDLQEWSCSTARVFGKSAIRRVGKLAHSVAHLGRASLEEIAAAYWAFKSDNFKKHLLGRGNDLVEFGVQTFEATRKGLDEISTMVQKHPSDGAAKILSAVLGFYTGSGGLDGNGGTPDLDLMLGIGAHRSLLTHSILAGIAIETAVFAIVELNNRIYRNLPARHDKFWDNLTVHTKELGDAFSRGASLGIAYHLFVDSTFQPAAYHDLPFSAPMWFHQSLLGTNAVAEGLDGITRGGSEPLPQSKSKLAAKLRSAGKVIQQYVWQAVGDTLTGQNS